MTEEIIEQAKRCAKLHADKRTVVEFSELFYTLSDQYVTESCKLSEMIACLPEEDQLWLTELYPALRSRYYSRR